jgi:small-conductance mechanosensitive channel
MKYKQELEIAQEKIRDLEYGLKMETKNLNEAKRENDKLNAILERIEGRESDVRRENEWLKTTLRLVIVDTGKIDKIVSELEKDQLGLRPKF